MWQGISDDIKQLSYEIGQKHHVIIKYMETDKDHMHYMIETKPTMSVRKIVNLMKKYERKLAKLQRQLLHKKKGSNYYKKRKEIAKCHEKITNTRKDYLYKISHEISAKTK